MSDKTNIDSPIVNSPFLPPKFHWPRRRRESGGAIVLTPKTDGESGAIEGRFPASGLLPFEYAGRNRMDSVGMSEAVRHLELVNEIRDEVEAWRQSGFLGATGVTKTLMRHWTTTDVDGYKPRKGLYYAQQEAIATRVWLTEIAPQSPKGRSILQEIDDANDAINEGTPRFCHMMATGTGKTAVMAALILWQTFNHREYPNDARFTNRFLAIAPTITVKQRLEQGLRWKTGGDVNERSEYRSPHLNLVPPLYNESKYLGEINLTVVNYHKFIPTKETPNRPGQLAGQQPREKTPDEIIREIMGHNPRPAFVINDEAHHCHNGFGGKRNKKDQAVYAWHNGVKMLHKRGLIHGHVADMSATPFFIEDPKSSLFPWIVSQYDLREAESAGIVKIMRLPETGMDPELARSIYAKTKDHKDVTRTDTDSRNADLKKGLAAMHENWKRANENWNSDAPPAMAIIVNRVQNASALYDYIAGYTPPPPKKPKKKNEKPKKDEKPAKEETRMGKLAEFSNVAPSGEPYPIPRTILIHSKIDDQNGAPPQQRAALEELAERYKAAYPDAETADNIPLKSASTMDVIRAVLNTVGKPNSRGKMDSPGEKVRCIISVDMLSEGWDARNVTHIVGFKRFGTQLICEQTAGRALRRLTHDVDEKGFFSEEYADIMGIPFESLRVGSAATLKDLPDPVGVNKLEDRAALSLRWPNVVGYWQDVSGGGLAINPPADWSAVERHRIPAHRNEIVITSPEAPAGETERIASLPVSSTRFMFDVAGEFVRKAIYDTASGALDARAIVKGESMVAARKLALSAVEAGALIPPPAGDGRNFPNANSGEARKVADWLWDAADVNGEDAVANRSVAVGEPEWLDTKSFTSYKTRRQRRHETKRSEIDVAVCDSGWEVSVAKTLDEHPAVSKWIRNERLGWTIPYFYDDTTRQYEPDFLAVMRLADGRELNVVIEVKGREHVADEAKRRCAEEWWIPCVNAHPVYGGEGREWTYLYLNEDPEKDELYVHRTLDALKREYDEKQKETGG